MPSSALHLLITLALAGLTRLVAYPLDLGGGRHIDALDAFLLMFALVNLRLGWSAANAEHGGRAPAWFVLLALVAAAAITFAMLSALTPAQTLRRAGTPALVGGFLLEDDLAAACA